MTDQGDQEGLILAGLDGANPLAFLAALGTLRTLTLAWPQRRMRMAWRPHVGAWRPVLAGWLAHRPLSRKGSAEKARPY